MRSRFRRLNVWLDVLFPGVRGAPETSRTEPLSASGREHDGLAKTGRRGPRETVVATVRMAAGARAAVFEMRGSVDRVEETVPRSSAAVIRPSVRRLPWRAQRRHRRSEIDD